MNAVLTKYLDIQNKLGFRLDELKQKPPMGFKPFITPLSQLFDLVRITGHHLHSIEQRIESLESQRIANNVEIARLQTELIELIKAHPEFSCAQELADDESLPFIAEEFEQ